MPVIYRNNSRHTAVTSGADVKMTTTIPRSMISKAIHDRAHHKGKRLYLVAQQLEDRFYGVKSPLWTYWHNEPAKSNLHRQNNGTSPTNWTPRFLPRDAITISACLRQASMPDRNCRCKLEILYKCYCATRVQSRRLSSRLQQVDSTCNPSHIIKTLRLPYSIKTGGIT